MNYSAVLGKAYEIGTSEIRLTNAEKAAFGVVVFMIATAAGAFVRIPLPFSPVPLTLQTFFVLLAGAFLGKRLGAVSQTAYALVGASGLPIFAGAIGGALHLFGPTGGYIAGFIAASFMVGQLLDARRDQKFTRVLFVMAAASTLILVMGASWLAFGLHLGVEKAVMLGILPFLPGDAVKTVTAAIIFAGLRSRVR